MRRDKVEAETSGFLMICVRIVFLVAAVYSLFSPRLAFILRPPKENISLRV